ncbi:MAG: serine protease [Nocardioides sp.]|nr:serine protease [Nocardioides sp.]
MRLLARIPLLPLIAVIVAVGVVAAVLLGTDSTSSLATNSESPGSSTSSSPTTAGRAGGGQGLQRAFVKVVQSVSPSVVQVEDQQGLGSGIVLDAAGHIVTNNHVVTGAKSFTVTTSTGKRYPATLVGSFAPDDLAVIKVSAPALKPATFGDSSKLQVGDIAIAIGNPLGLQSSVTEGIVSGFRQAMQENGGKVTLPSVIQTSAAINPGNSGGALVDIEGRVIGIPTLSATDPQLGGGSAPGIGFAIPSNLVKDIAGQIVANGKVVNSNRAFLGLRAGDTNGNGVIVGTVTPGGAAANAGIRVGDVIVSVAGTPTPTLGELEAALAVLKPGQTVPIVVMRQNGKTATVQLTLGSYPGS